MNPYRKYHRMSSSRVCFIAILGLLAFCLPAKADPYAVGGSFVGFKAPDQHGVAYAFKAGDANFVLFDTPGENGESAGPQDPNWFTEHHALLIVNISQFSFIKRDIARSRLESKPYRALVVSDTSLAARFPIQAGKVTIFTLDNKGKITAIRYATPGKEVQDLLTNNKSP